MIQPTKEVRDILGMRTYMEKFAVDQNFPPDDPIKTVVSGLVDEEYITIIDSGFFPYLNAKTTLDIYQLTDKGMAFCDEHNILARDP